MQYIKLAVQEAGLGREWVRAAAPAAGGRGAGAESLAVIPTRWPNGRDFPRL